MTRPREEVEAEIKELERLAAKRRGRVGFAANVAVIEEHIEAAKAELAEADGAANG